MTENRKTIIELQELQKALGLKGLPGKLISRFAYRLLELKEVNRIHEKYCDTQGPAFSAHVLEEVGVRYAIPEQQLDYIPTEGAFITVSNHHFGSVDGMILNTVIGSRRPDYKILTTFLLSMIPSLRDSFIPVDNFSSGGARSVSGIRAALGHIADGRPLGLFPAGEVATWQNKKNRTALGRRRVVEDIPWAENIIKLIRRSGLPVIPVYFQGENSRSFHILGKIHPRLRTVRLPHELFNKRGTTVQVRIGQAIPAEEIASMDVPTLGKYLRNRCYALEAQCQDCCGETAVENLAPLADPVPAERIRAEIDGLGHRMLFELGDYRAYLLHSGEAPDTMRELSRLREETFRAVGEGCGQAEDTDAYDAHYRQMILWHVPNREIVGAYRLGFGPEIRQHHPGLSGFYSATLYHYGPKAEPLLARSMELGRSFIVQKYQREVQPLRLLLTGLGVCTLEYPEMEFFSGPVSISHAIPNFYQSLAVRYIERNYPMPDAAQIAQAPHPFVSNFLSVDPDALLRIPEKNVDALDRLLLALSGGRYRLPVLVRKYFSCGARLVCFNVDPDFCDSLDGLIFLRYSDFPENTLRSIIRGLPDELQERVFVRFYGRKPDQA